MTPLTAAVLARECGECEGPEAQTCVHLVQPSLGAVRLSRDPPVIAHVSRIRDAIASGQVSRQAVLRQFGKNTVPAGI